MHPFLTLGDTIALDSWRVMVFLGILGGGLVSLLALKGEIGHTRALVVVSLMVPAALFGAHLAHWLLQTGIHHRDPRDILRFWGDGHSLFGALAFSGALLLLLSRIVPGIPFWTAADGLALGFPLGLFFARLGCHLKGCCWGTPITESHPFHGLSMKLLNNRFLALHPVQLYSAAAALAIFTALLIVRSRQKTPGSVAVLSLLLYASARFVLEFFRGDTRASVGVFTVYQVICLLLLLAGIGLCIHLLRSQENQGSGPRA